jgi:hypothetical protein
MKQENLQIEQMIKKPSHPSSEEKIQSPNKIKSLQKSTTISSGFFLSLKDGKSHLPISKEMMLMNIRKHLKGSSKDNSFGSKEGGIKGLKNKNEQTKEEEKDSDNEENSSISSNYNEYDNFLRVTFKSDFLYKIGKVCAKSGFMLEKALKYLNDFLLIINFYKQDMETKSYNKLRTHAIYYIGIAYFQLGDSSISEKMLREIQIDLIETQGKDSKKAQKIDKILSTYFEKRFNTMEQ